MLSYLAFVTKLKINNANWALYDMNFRQDRENTRAAWEIQRPDLQNGALQHFKRNAPTNPYQTEEKSRNPQKGDNPAWRYGYCLDFNRKTSYCKNKSDCKYKHAYSICSESHLHFLHGAKTKDGQGTYKQRSSRYFQHNNKSDSNHPNSNGRPQ